MYLCIKGLVDISCLFGVVLLSVILFWRVKSTAGMSSISYDSPFNGVPLIRHPLVGNALIGHPLMRTL